jgi:uncharacterized protein involved in response to NO
LVPLAVLAGANMAIHLEVADVTEEGIFLGLTVSVHVFALLITIIGGRIVPSFMANTLRQTGDDTGLHDNPLLARLSIAGMALVVIADLVDPAAAIRGLLVLAVAVVIAIRMVTWGGWRCRHQPILWVLHVAYAWLPISLALEGLSGLTDVLPTSAAVHGLTTGAIGTMTLAMMSRVALGHTGRPLVVAPAVTVAYGAITLAAIARIAAPLSGDLHDAMLIAGAAAWTLAFVFFFWTYVPILVQPRPEGKPG